MKKLTVVIALVLFLVPSLTMAAVSVQPGQYRVTTNLNVRYLPRVSSARINHLHKDEIVTVKRVVKGWCEIELKRYRQAWVNCSFLESAGSGTGAEVSANTASTYADFNGVKVGKTESGNWTLGNPDAKVTMEEFGDMECPYCAKYFVSTFPEIFKNYIVTGKVKYVYYNFPLSYHANAENFAILTLCAGEQDRFWPMHEIMLKLVDGQGSVSEEADILQTFITDQSVNMDNLQTCFFDETIKAQIDKDIAAGEKRNVVGTPAFFINGRAVEGAQPYETFKAEIESALNK